MYYYFNPDYHLKENGSKVLLINRYQFIQPQHGGETKFESSIPNIFAAILSCFNGKSLDETYEHISIKYNIDKTNLVNKISLLINNDEPVKLILENKSTIFPKRCIISSEEIIVNYSSIQLKNLQKVSINTKGRHHTPTDITLNLTTKCYTDCIYCYADRSNKFNSIIPLDRIKELILEAKEFNARSFDVTGGDYFLYPYWQEVIGFLFENGFRPYISTKKPLSDKEIDALVNLGVKEIQFSLDTFIKQKSIQLLGVRDNYLDLVYETFVKLRDNKIRVNLHTIITNINKDKESIYSLVPFVKEFENIYEWRIDEAFHSSFKSIDDNDIILPNKRDMVLLSTYLDDIAKDMRENVRITYTGEDYYYPDPIKTIDDFHKKRIGCSANQSALYILPDGKVTICEFLYWNKHFIIGDINKDSLINIWNSQHAIDLFNLTRDMISNTSTCKDCEGFDTCHNAKHFCWKDVVAAYGEDNWDFPDPQCPKAPIAKRQIAIKD